MNKANEFAAGASRHLPLASALAASKERRRLDIIVPIYKNADLVKACVDSLLANLHEAADHEPRLILINDSPDDADVEALLSDYAAAQAGVTLMRNEVNLGFVRSVNQGLAMARRDGHHVLLVNSDTQTFAGTLANLLSVAHADPQIGFVCPRSNNASICSLPHFHGGAIPTPEDAFRRWSEIGRTLPDYHFMPTAVGFYMFIAHAVIAGHAGLREDFGLGYEEENDLVMRAGKVGVRAVVANRSFAYHAGSASFGLLDFDLSTHKHSNLEKMAGFHPEFLPLVRRYEASPHYRTERLMTGLLPDAQGRLKVIFDLTGMGKHHNGTNEQAVAVLTSIAARHADRIRLAGLCSAESFKFHGLDKVAGLLREEPGSAGVHGVAIRMAQPFDMHHVNTLEGLAPVNFYAMLDTIAEDCGPLAMEGDFIELWDHVAEHANGLLFISDFSEQTFCSRHPAARALPRLTNLLPTKLASYSGKQPSGENSHVFVLGNHFAHKGSDVAARAIASAFPTLNVVTLGAETSQQNNLRSLRSGLLAQSQIDRLFSDASVVVLPSHEEGFGFGFMHALAAGRPIVARRIPATLEILATLDDVEGVFLFDHDAGLVAAVTQAMQAARSRAGDKRGASWDDWSDAVADFCIERARADDLFPRATRRITAADLLRRASRGDALLKEAGRSPGSSLEAVPPSAGNAKPVDLPSLMGLDGQAFVEHAYATLLLRPADASGLAFYVGELENGVSKPSILKALAGSSEARTHDVRLDGLDALLAQESVARVSLLKRLFGAARR